MTDKLYTRIDIEEYPFLERVAQEYNMMIEEMIAFHNNFCDFGDRIRFNVPKQLNYLCIPSDKHKARQARRLQTTYLSLPTAQSKRLYAVVITCYPQKLQIHHNVLVERYADGVRLDKGQTFVNNQETGKFTEQLFEKAERAFYPLELSIHGDGSIRYVTNGTAILKRWGEKTLPELRKYYDSDLANAILDHIDLTFKEIHLLSGTVIENLFFSLYFPPIYVNYPDFNMELPIPLHFSSLGKPCTYHATASLAQDYSSNQKIILRLHGREIPTIFDSAVSVGEISLEYQLDRVSREIVSIDGFVSTYERGQHYKITFQLSEIGEQLLKPATSR